MVASSSGHLFLFHLKRNVHASMLRLKQVAFLSKEESRIDSPPSDLVDNHHHVLKSTTSFMGSSALTVGMREPDWLLWGRIAFGVMAAGVF